MGIGILRRIQGWYRALPDKKQYVELLTAVLSVPVLLTVILINLGNLRKSSLSENEQKQVQPTPIMTTGIIERGVPMQDDAMPSPTPLPSPTQGANQTVSIEQCKPSLGPVEIIYPKEREQIESDPVCIDISYTLDEYCAAVWSYRINGSMWSDYTDKSICLYNLPAGEKTLNLRVKSIVSGDERVLTRQFTVIGPTPSPTVQAASESGTKR